MEKINLKEEIICDYKVTRLMKEVWQCELDMLEEVDKICKKNNINYFLAGGTLIGAVRHKGYIPWDDDIDIVMMREGYNKFLKIAEKELNGKYFLQYYKTEKKYNRGHAQIRNSETTAIINGDKHNNFNKGIFIDIFPLDNIPDDEKKCDKFINKVSRKKKFLDNYYNLDSKCLMKKIIKRLYHYLIYSFINYDKKIEKYERFVSQYSKEDTNMVSAISFCTNLPKYKKEWFKRTIYMDFEYMQLPCPYMYDKVLRAQYGDYMKIPKQKNTSMHGSVFFDTKKSYIEYEEKREIYKKSI